MIPREVVDVATTLLTEGLIVVVAVFLATKALLFDRHSRLGRALAASNLAMAAVYASIVVSWWVVEARHPLVAIPLRLLVAVTTLQALRAFAAVYGGWRGVAREVWRSAREWARLPH